MKELGYGRKRNIWPFSDGVNSDWVFGQASAIKAKKKRLQYDDNLSEEVGDNDTFQFHGMFGGTATLKKQRSHGVGIDGGKPCITVGSILKVRGKNVKVAPKPTFSSLNSCREAFLGELKEARACMFQWMRQEIHGMLCEAHVPPIPNQHRKSSQGLKNPVAHVVNVPISNPSAGTVATTQGTPSFSLAATGSNPSVSLVTVQVSEHNNVGSSHGFAGQSDENGSRGGTGSYDNSDGIDSSYGMQASGNVEVVVNISGENEGSDYTPEVGIANHKSGQRTKDSASLDVWKEVLTHDREETGQVSIGLIDCSVKHLEQANEGQGGMDLSIQSDVSKSEHFSGQSGISRNISEHHFHAVCGVMVFGSETPTVGEMDFGLEAYPDGDSCYGAYRSVRSVMNLRGHGSVKEASEFRASLIPSNIIRLSADGGENYQGISWRAPPKVEGLQSWAKTAEICNSAALNADWNMRQQGGRSINSSVPDSGLMSFEYDVNAKFGSSKSISVASLGSGIDNPSETIRSVALKNTSFGLARQVPPSHAFDSMGMLMTIPLHSYFTTPSPLTLPNFQGLNMGIGINQQLFPNVDILESGHDAFLSG